MISREKVRWMKKAKGFILVLRILGVVLLQDSLNHCPMPINTDKKCVIDPNVDRCKYLEELISIDL